jgi:hypothetical protein
MSRSESSRFPVTVSRLPVTRCEVCGRTLAYRPGQASAVLTQHYNRMHPEALTGPADKTGLGRAPEMSMATAAMIAWVLTASIGVYMLRTWVTRGGLRRQRATGAGVPPAVVFGHASAALIGLLIWLGFVGTGLDLLAWLGVTVVAGAITLGVCTVTLWTPYPVAVPAPAAAPQATPAAEPGTVTDEMIAELLADPFPASRRPRLKLAGLVPVAHGFAALITFMLAVLAAISAR